MLKLKQGWSNLRSSFWFVPTLIVAVNMILAIALVEIDSSGNGRWMTRWPRLFGAGAEGSRQMLSTLSGTMMSVLGLTFSMTLVALALASSQYTSRILRNFMRSRVTQTTLGIFAGIFSYCLIVLRTIRSSGGTEFVPGLAVFFGFILALGSVGVLIFFIHHIASSIQASSIIASVTQETIASVDRLFTQPIGQDHAENEDVDQLLRSLAERTWRAVPAKMSGYIQGVDGEALLRLARERKVLLRMERGIGDFVVRDTALVSLDQDSPLEPETIAALNAAYSISTYRTVDQDPAFGVRQIVDMALKALSPGVNDTSTAIMCVDYLTAILARLATREFPPARRYDAGGLRVISIVPTFAGLLAAAFDQIRQSAVGNVAIMSRLLGALETLAGLTTSPQCRSELGKQVQRLAELAHGTIDASHDRAWIKQRLQDVQTVLGAEAPACPGAENGLA